MVDVPKLDIPKTPLPPLDQALARRLVDSQFPQWADLPVRRVDLDGWDNRTFRLGDELTVRLPSGDWYALQVEKEQRWLPVLAPQLPLPIPSPVAQGAPGQGYPFSWSVYRWLEGQPSSREAIADLTEFADTLADFLLALHRVDASDGPGPGPHNFFRGGSLATYASETSEAVENLGDEIDGRAALACWDAAMAAEWTGDPVWLHGDIATGNLLLRDGRLGAVIDFGTSGVGDPSCDVVIAWTLFSGESRAVFRDRLGVDDGTWSRAPGGARWKALIVLVGQLGTDPAGAAVSRHVIDEVLADFARAG
ncbi:MAG: aminoglycoside phosphotransferase family protein [Propionibacteriaceae bacterium]